MSGREVPPVETVRYRKDGSPLDVIVAGSPILVGDELIGSVTVHTDITERKRAEEELKRSFEKLQRVLDSTIQAMARIVETRDLYTAGHQRPVTQLACAIAKEMGLPEDQIEGVRMAGRIHDIGKINVPAEILSKPGPLAELEYGLIQAH